MRPYLIAAVWIASLYGWSRYFGIGKVSRTVVEEKREAWGGRIRW